jgi:hypothetical protein
MIDVRLFLDADRLWTLGRENRIQTVGLQKRPVEGIIDDEKFSHDACGCTAIDTLVECSSAVGSRSRRSERFVTSHDSDSDVHSFGRVATTAHELPLVLLIAL